MFALSTGESMAKDNWSGVARKETVFQKHRLHVAESILASCIPFNVVPSLLIAAQRSIELQTAGVNPRLSSLSSSNCLTRPFLRSATLALRHFANAHNAFLSFSSCLALLTRTIRISFPSNYNSSLFQIYVHVFICPRHQKRLYFYVAQTFRPICCHTRSYSI